jgi:uncharacterized protein YuzB (UPF0349 family)
MMIQSRCKFKLKRIRSALGRIIYSCLTYSTLVVGLFLLSNGNGEYLAVIINEIVFQLVDGEEEGGEVSENLLEIEEFVKLKLDGRC